MEPERIELDEYAREAIENLKQAREKANMARADAEDARAMLLKALGEGVAATLTVDGEPVAVVRRSRPYRFDAAAFCRDHKRLAQEYYRQGEEYASVVFL